MYSHTRQATRLRTFTGLTFKAAFALALFAAAPAAFAQDTTAPQTLSANITSPGGSTALGNQVAAGSLLRAAASFFSVGGYFFTSGSAHRELGTPKFYSDTQIFAKPKHFPLFDLTGGVEIISANDHFFPFQGGNELDLIGPAFKVSTHRVLNRFRPFVTGGLFLGRARSITATPGFDRSNFTPSISAGVEFPLRYITVYAAYRVNHEIHQINTDGVSVGVRFF